MTIGYKTKPNVNGNCKRLIVHHDTKVYSLEEYGSDIDLVVKAKAGSPPLTRERLHF